MSKRKSLNERRLTKKQVAGLMSDGVIGRPDLERAFVDAKIGLRPPSIYELHGGILQVFNEAESGLGGKGDIYDLDYYRRFLEWATRTRDNAKAGRGNSVSHWFHYSKLPNGNPDSSAATS